MFLLLWALRRNLVTGARGADAVTGNFDVRQFFPNLRAGAKRCCARYSGLAGSAHGTLDAACWPWRGRFVPAVHGGEQRRDRIGPAQQERCAQNGAYRQHVSCFALTRATIVERNGSCRWRCGAVRWRCCTHSLPTKGCICRNESRTAKQRAPRTLRYRFALYSGYRCQPRGGYRVFTNDDDRGRTFTCLHGDAAVMIARGTRIAPRGETA